MNDPLEFIPFVLSGIKWTVSLSLLSMTLAVVIGLLGALGRITGPRLLRRFIVAYITIFRGVPELVWIFLIYFGGQTALNWLGKTTGLWSYFEISQFTAGVLTLGLVMGAYMVETFRGAALAIPKGQIEAAIACGLSNVRLLYRIVWPQLFRNSYASLSNNWLGLIKATALVSIIGLPDIVRNAHVAGRSTEQPFTFLLIALVFYLLFTAVSELVLRYLDARNRAGGWSE